MRRPCYSFLLLLSVICIPSAGQCDSMWVGMSHAAEEIQPRPSQERLSAQEPDKAFRGFFGYLEYDFDPDKPVPGFGPLPQSTQEIEHLRAEGNAFKN